jgi:hypothetical protein
MRCVEDELPDAVIPDKIEHEHGAVVAA